MAAGSGTAELMGRGRAPAKVNLLLRVLERENDGFHRLETVFQALELADEVEVSRTAGARISLSVTGVPEGAIGPPEKNLAWRAAARLVGTLEGGGAPPPGIAIRLHKQIPHGAGLGGGSSDAAAVLLAVNDLLEGPLAPNDLVRVGKELGADVPFFLTGAVRAIGHGRGDDITPLPPLPRRPVLLAIPSPGISTGWAYGVLSARRILSGDPAGRASRAAWSAETDWATVAGAARNDFEAALFPHRPELGLLKEALHRAGASPALLSGSGSAVFGVFDSDDRAALAACKLGEAFPSVRLLPTHTAE
jgi:4-diphosphocytidyl-2-C-methyl-D-erythritol kinase